MKTYTDAQRLDWTVAKNPTIECDEQAVTKGSKYAFGFVSGLSQIIMC